MGHRMQQVTLVGFGAIGQSIFERLGGHAGVVISHVVVPQGRVAQLQAQLGSAAQVCAVVPGDTQLLLECAGHAAITQHVLPALSAGVECALLSIGALAEPGLAQQLEDAAKRGGTQVHLLAGAIGGIDAIAAARLAGLSAVTYTGRKPPAGWRGTAAEQQLDLSTLVAATVVLEGTARQAAQMYPKNANVAATVSLAGLGLDATRVRLIADPGVTENIHEIDARGEFGEIHITMRGKPLAGNPKTSALTVLSALRFLHNRVSAVTI